MVKLKKSLISIACLTSFLSAMIGAAQASPTYYYFYESDLVVGSCDADDPFDCEEQEVVDELINIVSPSEVAFLSSDSSLSFTVSLKSGKLDLSSATLVANVPDGAQETINSNITLTPVSGKVATWTMTVSKHASATASETSIELTASAEGEDVTKDITASVASSAFTCSSSNPLANMYQDTDGSTYLIGRDIVEGEIYDASDDSTYVDSGLVAREQLLCMSNYQTSGVLSSDYKMTADVVFSISEDWNKSGSDAEGWIPLGDDTTYFTGNFDGDSHSINNLYINRPADANQGFFAKIRDAKIQNINFNHRYVSGANFTAGVVASSYGNTIISSVVVLGNVTGVSYVGGIIAYPNDFTQISKCAYVGDDVSGEDYIGGVAGFANGSLVIDGSYSTADVTAEKSSNGSAGGLVGYLGGGAVARDCYATGDVKGKKWSVGGLMGVLVDSFLINSYSTGYVSSTGARIGGLVGNVARSSIVNSYSYWSRAPYSTGADTAREYWGALVGKLDSSTIDNAFNKCEHVGTTSTSINVSGYTCANNASKNIDDINNMKIDMTYGEWNDDYWYDLNSSTPELEWAKGGSFDSNMELVNSPAACASGDPFKTEDNGVYVLTTKEQLLCLSQSQYSDDRVLTSSYRLDADIDFGSDESAVDWDGDGVADGSGTEGWMPLGSMIAFSGNFNGNGNLISNLYINSSGNNKGFLGTTIGSLIENLGLSFVEVYGDNSHTGSLIGSAGLGSVVNGCYVSGGSVNSDGSNVGGLAGRAYYSSEINNSYANVLVNGNSSAGGLVGSLHSGAAVKNSYAKGNVTGSYYVGGLVGTSNTVYINNCYSMGKVTGKTMIGGLIGWLIRGGVNNSYAYWSSTPTSTSSSTGFIGGLVGRNYATDPGVINNGTTSCNDAGLADSSTIGTYRCSSAWGTSYINTIQNNSSGATPWSSDIWDGLGTATPTLKGLPN